MNLQSLFEQRDILNEKMARAAERHDYITLMRLTHEHMSVTMDIDHMRRALAEHVGRQFGELKNG